MLIALYFLIVNEMLPRMGEGIIVMINIIMPALIIFIGIIFLIKAIAPKSSQNIGPAMTRNLSKALSSLCKNIFEFFKFLVTKVAKLFPWIFCKTKAFLLNKNVSAPLANGLATGASLMAIVIII